MQNDKRRKKNLEFVKLIFEKNIYYGEGIDAVNEVLYLGLEVNYKNHFLALNHCNFT